jgi:hypothetical protein
MLSFFRPSHDKGRFLIEEKLMNYSVMKFGRILFQTSSDQSVVTELRSSFTIILLKCVQFHVHDLIFLVGWWSNYRKPPKEQ